MSVNSVAGAAPGTPYAPPVQAHALQSTSLLAEPEMKGLDTMGRLYVLMSKDSQLSAESSKDQILSASEQKQKELEKHIAALKKAEAKRNNGSFWSNLGSTLAKVAGVVGAAALTISTCGAGAVPLALALGGIGLSGAAMAQNEWHYLEEIGVSSEVAGYLSAGAAVTGGILTAGSGLAGSAASGTLSTIADVSLVASGATSVAAGGAGITGAVYERSAAGFDIQAFKAQQRADAMQRELLAFIAELEETSKRDRDNVGRIVNSIESQGMAVEMASQGV